MSNKGEVAGFNTRFSDDRYKGFDGDKGANVFPWQTAEVIAIADPTGTYDGTTTIPILSAMFTVIVEVTEVFNNTPTLIVGRAGGTNILVNLTDAVDLTTLGTTTINRAVEWPANAVVRCTIGGTPDQGAGTVTVQYEV